MQLTCHGRDIISLMGSVRHGCGCTLTACISLECRYEDAVYLQAASGPARQVLFSKKRRFQKMKQWVVEKAANAKTKAAKLFNCLAPKAAQ